MNKRTCTQTDCNASIYAKELCRPHYRRSRPRPADPTEVATCSQCGNKWQRAKRNVTRYANVFCSSNCQWEHWRNHNEPKPPPAKKARRVSALTEALRSNDHEGVITALRSKTTLAGECWEWQGRFDTKGYARVTAMGKPTAAYRVMLEAKLRQTLGSQSAHHTCSNTKCVNPHHLQAVTDRENIAEMLARKAYTTRIEELEQALREHAPEHELLNHRALAGVRRTH